MNKSGIRKAGDINNNILSVITNDWQTSSIIACQVVLPPEVVKRVAIYKLERPGRWGSSERGVRSDVVYQRLKTLVAKGLVESRSIDGRKNEYRLAQPKETQ